VKHHCPDSKILLVGTKEDLKGDRETLEKLAQNGQSPITSSLAENMARDIKAFGYVECSSLTQKNLKTVFDVAIKAVIFPNKGKKSSQKCTIL
jgi:GTPase SAR1 family protein